MNPLSAPSSRFHAFTKVVVLFSVLLIWWGAATTTKDAGMVFADWPLSLGSVNPPKWLSHMVPFLEHSHRLLATLVGLLVLALFGWAYVRSLPRALELVGLVVLLAVVFGLYIAAGAERLDPERKASLMANAAGSSLLPLGWLAWSWWGRRWTVLEKLCALALLTVTAQAILGGLRVTEISDTFAVLHGCLGQFFFCLLVLIVMSSSERWRDTAFAAAPDGRPSLDRRSLSLVRLGGAGLLAMISCQLLLGAWMRHHHRFGLVDEGLLKTQGAWIPPFEDSNIAAMFLHKAFALGILLFLVGLVLKLSGAGPTAAGSRKPAIRHLLAVLVFILAQIALGLSVIATGKQFWVTNFHVLNGLLILASIFAFVVRAWWRPRPALPAAVPAGAAAPEGEGEGAT